MSRCEIVRFYFSDADPVAECGCGWRGFGDAPADAFRAWWQHSADSESRDVIGPSSARTPEFFAAGLSLEPRKAQTMSFEQSVKNAATMHDKLAEDTRGFGGFLRCEHCGYSMPLGDHLASYYRQGWPRCCGYTMRWWTQRQIDAGEVPPPLVAPSGSLEPKENPDQ